MGEFLSSGKEALFLAMSGKRPLAALTAMHDGTPKRRLSPVEAKQMRRDGRIEELVVLCLPSVVSSISRYCDFGISEQDLLAVGLLAAVEAIHGWQPEETGNRDGSYLKCFVHRKVGQRAREFIVEQYGLKGEYNFPVVKAFRECLIEHLDRTGQRPTMAGIVKAVEKALPGCQFEMESPSGEEAPHRVEVIYQHFFKRRLPVSSVPVGLSQADIEVQVEQTELIVEFNQLLKLVIGSSKGGKRLSDIFIRSYVLGQTDKRIAHYYEISGERVAQLRRRAIYQIKKYAEAVGFSELELLRS